ncbi:MAG: DUF2520 domain-containing protein [Crocinitomicaceae bacterium]
MAISSVCIIGTGNMAENLIRAFKTAGISVEGLYGRNQEKRNSLCLIYQLNPIENFKDIPKESLVVLAVSDQAIQEVSANLNKNLKVVHTSGSVAIDAIKVEQRGVFYPLQTMTSNRKIDFFQVPVLIEAQHQDFLLELKMLGIRMTDKVREVSSEQRKKIHLAAVILNNFMTELVKLSGDYMQKIGEDNSLLTPLLKETVGKIEEIGADNALTGPAKRGDINTITSHLEMLEGDLKEVYQLMSNIILKENGKL